MEKLVRIRHFVPVRPRDAEDARQPSSTFWIFAQHGSGGPADEIGDR